jgi:hypothetical protein
VQHVQRGVSSGSWLRHSSEECMRPQLAQWSSIDG